MTEGSEKMNEVLKDSDAPHPVPSVWRPSLARLAEIIAGIHPDEESSSFSKSDLMRWRSNISDYGVVIGSVPEESWESSVVQWMDGYWDVLVDLYTESGVRTDLAMSVRVYEKPSGYEFKADSVHVP